MFQRIGELVTRFAPVVVILWIALAAGLFRSYRSFDTVVVDGEFAYLPDDAPSRRAEALYEQAFDDVDSSVVIVVRRPAGESGLKDRDRRFIDEVLKPRLVAIAEAEGGLAKPDPEGDSHASPEDLEYVLDRVRPRVEEIAAEEGWETHFVENPTIGDDETAATSADGGEPDGGGAEGAGAEDGEAEGTEPEAEGAETDGAGEAGPRSVIARVRTPSDREIGKLLLSEDGRAALVMVDLTIEFLEKRNRSTIKAIEVLLAELSSDTELRREWGSVGLDTAISGTAAVGRDRRLAEEHSARQTEFWTILLVVLLLILIYRAPLLALVPLVTVALSVIVAIGWLSVLAGNGVIGLFTGVKIYVIVLVYGAGVDYCLFLLARYKEELDAGASIADAISNSVGKVGAALAASGGTTMCGIGMMYFADFGKFSEAGIAIPLSLLVVLLASLTFTPALLRLCGSWAFWPHLNTRQLPQRSGWISPTSFVSRVLESEVFTRFWERMGGWLLARPATIWLSAVALLLPFAVVGVVFYEHLSYGLLSELPQDRTSVVGAEAVQDHFPAGTTGPVTVLVENPGIDFASRDGQRTIRDLSENLEEHAANLGIADIRSVAEPWGLRRDATVTERAFLRRKAPEYYVSEAGEHAGHLTRMEVVFTHDPFDRESIAEFEQFERRLPALLPEELEEGTMLRFVGPTPSIRDLKYVTDDDQIRVDVIVSLAVFLILVQLLGRRSPWLVAALVVAHFAWMIVAVNVLGMRLSEPGFWIVDAILVLAVIGLRGNAAAKSAYLMLSVLFGYFVTMGVTIAVFYLADPTGFAGLDWKVPMFLFTILVAVGQDYNIYLVTRVEEEQERYGPVDGIPVALARTGGIISSCGLIMAGTFAALLAGSLVGMHQLGFALAFGVMLDTFVIRPILVPAYLILLHGGRFGALGRFLGAGDFVAKSTLGKPIEVGHGPRHDH